MKETTRILAALLFVALVQLIQAESNSSQLVGAKVFDQINDLLAGSSSLDDKLAALIQEQSSIAGAEDSYFAKTLKTFVALKELLDGSFGLVVPLVETDDLVPISTCNRRGYEILRKTYKALSSYKDEPRQIEFFVNECAVKHAKFCSKFYMQGFDKEYQSLKKFQKLRNSLATIFEQIVLQEEPQRSRELQHIIADKMVYYRSGDAKLYYDALVEMATANNDPYLRHLFADIDEETGKSDYNNMIDTQRIKLILSKYFVTPCKDYMNRFGPDYFVPIALDHTVLAPFERFDGIDLNSELVKRFINGWRDYRLCRNVLKDNWQEKILRDIASIVYHAAA